MQSVVRHERIKEIRQERGMSRAEFARRLKVQWQTVWNIEEGHTTPNFDVGIRIARVLGVPAEELAHDEE